MQHLPARKVDPPPRGRIELGGQGLQSDAPSSSYQTVELSYSQPSTQNQQISRLGDLIRVLLSLTAAASLGVDAFGFVEFTSL